MNGVIDIIETMKWEETGVPGENPRRQLGLEPMHM